MSSRSSNKRSRRNSTPDATPTSGSAEQNRNVSQSSGNPVNLRSYRHRIVPLNMVPSQEMRNYNVPNMNGTPGQFRYPVPGPPAGMQQAPPQNVGPSYMIAAHVQGPPATQSMTGAWMPMAGNFNMPALHAGPSMPAGFRAPPMSVLPNQGPNIRAPMPNVYTMVPLGAVALNQGCPLHVGAMPPQNMRLLRSFAAARQSRILTGSVVGVSPVSNINPETAEEPPRPGATTTQGTSNANTHASNDTQPAPSRTATDTRYKRFSCTYCDESGLTDFQFIVHLQMEHGLDVEHATFLAYIVSGLRNLAMCEVGWNILQHILKYTWFKPFQRASDENKNRKDEDVESRPEGNA
ncbi:hypothetical protein CVT24_007500 [Panaeolus cyanescens]|uniref:Uncharacterized protein n=1 Tax=Panaeolus cyanescens TaxID=181874 RepID=A0A409W9W6_9AGAR|nr:hypothetical protein CVT24_007500 [Panaeolus cyanescens]